MHANFAEVFSLQTWWLLEHGEKIKHPQTNTDSGHLYLVKGANGILTAMEEKFYLVHPDTRP